VILNIPDQLLIGFFCIRQILEKKQEGNETVHQLFIDCKKACDSVRSGELYKILMSLGHETS
jgi:hypothetical protein